MIDATQTARVLIDGIEDIHSTVPRRISTARALAGTCRGFGGLAWEATALQLDAYAARHQRAARGPDVAPSSFCAGMGAR